MVQKRGWSVSAGGSIQLAGKGRTLEVIRQEVIAKVLAEAREQAQQPALPEIRVAEGDRVFATSRDLCEWHHNGWECSTDTPEPVLTQLAGEVLQAQSRRRQPAGHTRWAKWGPYSIELSPMFTFRGRMLGDVPCVGVLVSHLAKAPPEMTVAELCGANTDRALGLEVQALPARRRGRIVGYVGQLGVGQTRAQLLEVTTTNEMREAIQGASDFETVWQVQFVHREGPPKVLTYIGSKLQPQLTFSNLERLESLLGSSASSSQLGRASILRPSERRQLVDAELERLQNEIPGMSSKLFPSSPVRVCSGDSKLRRGLTISGFASFTHPRLIVGDGQVVKASHGGGVWAALEKHGLYKHEPNIGAKVTLRGYVLGKGPKKQDFARARSALSKLADLLRSVHLDVDLGLKPIAGAMSVTKALSNAEDEGAHAVILFSASGSTGWYYEAKEQCFHRKAPGLAHLASQWVDLSRPDHQRPALLNMALQLCGKLGHTPFVLETGSLHGSDARGPVLCGVDVCHLNNPRAGKMEHVIAGLQLQKSNGEVEHSWICQGHIEGESIPATVWQTVVSKEACEGREVVIHRDGRFTEKEKEFLAKHAKQIGASDGAFALVEIVKYAGGTPRMYTEDGNPPSGSFLRLSETEGLLISGSCPKQGTRNPLLVRVVGSGPGQPPKLSVEAAAEDIFRLSLVSYGSLYASPRLPVTTKTADKAAYFHASAEVNRADPSPTAKEFVPKSHGRQQYWL